MAASGSPEEELTTGTESRAFRVRALAQAHPLSPAAHHYVNAVVERERKNQPSEEVGLWSGYALTTGYCLRRLEEVEVLGEKLPEIESAGFEDLDRASSEIAAAVRTTGPESRYLLPEETVIEELDELIGGEIDRRLDGLDDQVDADTRRELEEYIAWWLVKGYGLRVAETLDGARASDPGSGRVLVACVGNVLRSDDGVGPRIAEILEERDLPGNVDVVDFGIGGIHLVQALLDGKYRALVVVDCADRDRPPGTVMLIEPEVLDVHELDHIEKYDYLADMHYTNPERALALAKGMNVLPSDTVMVGIQPADAETLGQELSPAIEGAVEVAAREIIRVAVQLGGGVET